MLDDLNEEYRFVPIKMETTGLIMNNRDFSHLTSTSIKTSTFLRYYIQQLNSLISKYENIRKYSIPYYIKHEKCTCILYHNLTEFDYERAGTAGKYTRPLCFMELTIYFIRN